MKMDKTKWLNIILLVAILALVALLLVDLFPLLKAVYVNREDESETISYINAYGTRGMWAIVGLQALQVVVAFFPSLAIQMLAGLCYGVWLGALLCVVGYLVGNLLVFGALRQFKKSLGSLFQKKESAKKRQLFNVEKIKQMKNPEVMVFLLFLVPGLPNGILPYIFAGTNITFARYISCVTVASIPSVLFCTWLGYSVSQKHYLQAIIMSAVMAAILLLVFLKQDKLMDKINTFAEKLGSREKN